MGCRKLDYLVLSHFHTDHGLENEVVEGKVDHTRVWWVQAETVIGFLNGYEKEPERTEYLEGAEK